MIGLRSESDNREAALKLLVSRFRCYRAAEDDYTQNQWIGRPETQEMFGAFQKRIAEVQKLGGSEKPKKPFTPRQEIVSVSVIVIHIFGKQ